MVTNRWASSVRTTWSSAREVRLRQTHITFTTHNCVVGLVDENGREYASHVKRVGTDEEAAAWLESVGPVPWWKRWFQKPGTPKKRK